MISAIIRKPVNITVTLLLWFYYIFGFLLSFLPYLLVASLRRKNREEIFQIYVHYFFKVFFKLVKILVPGIDISIDPHVREIKSSVIICNHLSYLDPILLISLYKRQKTIVKNSFFKIPIFSWLLRNAGYVPSSANGKGMPLVVKHLSTMKKYLNQGGNLFVFPEGTRSRDGSLGEFSRGAFTIAENARVPLKVVLIENTHVLFTPGRFFFNTGFPNTIQLKLIATLDPEEMGEDFTAEHLMRRTRELFEPYYPLRPN